MAKKKKKNQPLLSEAVLKKISTKYNYELKIDRCLVDSVNKTMYILHIDLRPLNMAFIFNFIPTYIFMGDL